MAIPEVLAAPPWPKPRKRSVLDLLLNDSPERIVWAPGEREGFSDPGLTSRKHPDDHYEELGQNERDRAILGALAGRKILPMYAARYLSLDAMKEIARATEVDVRFIEHYLIVSVALGKFELEALPLLIELHARMPGVVFRAFMRIDSPRVARFLLDKHIDVTREWYLAYPRTTAHTLIPIAVGQDAKRAELAQRALDVLDHALVFEVARGYGEAAEAEVRALLAPPPLPPRPPKLPAWLDVGALPGPVDHPGATRILCELLALHPLEAARAAVLSAKAGSEPASFARFLGALTDAWIAAGAPGKDKWALFAPALFGGDDIVRKIVPHLSVWVAEKKYKPTALAVEALALAKTDLALMHLSHLTKSKNKTLRKRAEAAREAAREALGLSIEELGDRLVPDLGLDEEGGSWLDYGPRKFRISFDESLAPMLTDDSGARLRTVPRPNKDDDAAKAERAQERWRSLKAETKLLGKNQVDRLEKAMVTGRFWDAAAFRRLFVEHPLMIHLARRLIWRAGTTTFRVAEDRSLAGSDDAPFVLSNDARVVIPHPLAMRDDERQRWGTLISDYAIIQPFLQLGREIFTPTEEELRTGTIRRFEGQRVEGGRFYSLKAREWSFPDYQIGKTLSDTMVALLETEPGLNFLQSKPPDQVLGAITLRRPYEKPHMSEIDPIAFSELVRDVALLLK